MQLNLAANETSNSNALQTAAAIATGVAFPDAQKKTDAIDKNAGKYGIFFEVKSNTEVYDYATANQVVQAGLSNSPLTQNAFLTSAQMDNMQNAYIRGTKVFVIRDSSRCFMIPVATMTQSEKSLMAQSFANCVSR